MPEPTRKFLVRIERKVETQWVDIQMSGDDEEDASKKALELVYANEGTYFDLTLNVQYVVNIDITEEI